MNTEAADGGVMPSYINKEGKLADAIVCCLGVPWNGERTSVGKGVAQGVAFGDGDGGPLDLFARKNSHRKALELTLPDFNAFLTEIICNMHIGNFAFSA